VDRYILIYIDALSASLLIRTARKSTCFTRLAYNARHKGFRNKGRFFHLSSRELALRAKIVPFVDPCVSLLRATNKTIWPGKCSYALSGILMKLLGKSDSELQNFSLVFRELRRFESRNRFHINLMNINNVLLAFCALTKTLERSFGICFN